MSSRVRSSSACVGGPGGSYSDEELAERDALRRFAGQRGAGQQCRPATREVDRDLRQRRMLASGERLMNGANSDTGERLMNGARLMNGERLTNGERLANGAFETSTSRVRIRSYGMSARAMEVAPGPVVGVAGLRLAEIGDGFDRDRHGAFVGTAETVGDRVGERVGPEEPGLRRVCAQGRCARDLAVCAAGRCRDRERVVVGVGVVGQHVDRRPGVSWVVAATSSTATGAMFARVTVITIVPCAVRAPSLTL